MPKLPLLTPKKLLKVLLKIGFKIDRTTGSHYILFSSASRKRITIPFHTKDLPKGTLHSIIISAEMSIEDLKKYL